MQNPEFFSSVIPMHTAGLLVVRNRKLLLAYSKNKNCFYLPGGKIDIDESPEDALRREIAEELNVELDSNDLVYYTHISAPAFGEKEGVMMEQECFFVWKEIHPHASAEINELRFFSLEEYLEELNKAPGAIIILERLKLDNFID
jgi:8-oxo-dGTP pyrophosphatase MutT (NUDIX family)